MSDDNTIAGARILVVDDAPQNVKLLQLILKDAGYRVIEAYSGREALDKVRQERPDAVILDVRMPGMTGYEVCETLRREPDFATLPIIMVTALSLPEERLRGIEAGATDFIAKPFNKKELLARVQTSLALARAQQPGVIEQLPGAVVITDAEWRVLAFSPRAATLLGLSAASAPGGDFRPMLEPGTGDWSADAGGIFQVRTVATQLPLLLRHTPVRNAAEQMLLRILVLSGQTEGGREIGIREGR